MNKIYMSVLAMVLSACAHYENGSIGAAGHPGHDGKSCTVSDLGSGALVSCEDGTSAYIANGVDGATGAVGPAGDKGDSGAPGINATPVTIVNLCPGATQYPSTFVEIALDINGKLYAVYSTNGGFLTYIPPGNYRSNAVGSKCDFTVNSDATVSW